MGTRADRSPSRYPQHRHSPPQRKRHFPDLSGDVEAYVSEMIGGSYMVEGDADKTDTSTADDTTSDSVSEEVDDMDADFMKTCNLHCMALIESWDLG